MENYLIKHCSPTLASIKTANLFSYAFSCAKEFEYDLQRVNKVLNEKGVYVESLRVRGGKALIWVYRKSQLEERLQQADIARFLELYGYQLKQLSDVVKRLKERVFDSEKFPHEIGVFLGYPLSDVIAFIKYGGKHSKCTGCWKVYTNEYEAVRLFEMYERCHKVYRKMFLLGKSVKQLTVAA